MFPLPYCASSHLMSYLTTFRNLHGKEESWPSQEVTDQTLIPYNFYAKAAFAEIGFGLLTVAASAEMVVYGIFMMVSMAAWPISKKPARFFCILVDSGITTAEWASENLHRNLIIYNLPTREPLTEIRARRIECSLLEQRAKQLMLLVDQLNVLEKKVFGLNVHLKD